MQLQLERLNDEQLAEKLDVVEAKINERHIAWLDTADGEHFRMIHVYLRFKSEIIAEQQDRANR